MKSNKNLNFHSIFGAWIFLPVLFTLCIYLYSRVNGRILIIVKFNEYAIKLWVMAQIF